MADHLCPICRQGLQFIDAPDRSCSFCGHVEPSDHACPKGHYTCEACRTDALDDVIERICQASKTTNPWELLNLLFSHRFFQQHGPQFHLVVPPVICRVLANRGVTFPNAEKVSDFESLSDIPAFACASRGACGAAIGAGVVVSKLLGATPMKGKERSLALQATAAALQEIAQIGTSRCCRQSVIATVTILGRFLPKFLNLPGWPESMCPASHRLPECVGKECPYYE